METVLFQEVNLQDPELRGDVGGGMVRDWTLKLWFHASQYVQGMWDLPAGPAAAHGDSPRILFWKLCPVINLLSVISTLKYFVVVSDNSTFTGFETLTCQRGLVDWQGCGFPWSALTPSRTHFPELCPTFLLCHWCTGTSCLWGAVF